MNMHFLLSAVTGGQFIFKTLFKDVLSVENPENTMEAKMTYLLGV